MSIKIKKDGTYTGASNHTEVIRALAQFQGHTLASAVTAITNNSGGTADTVVGKVAEFANVADVSTSLAQKAATETALALVKDGLLELATTANLLATAVGITGLTYNGGGTAADGTLGAITVAVTAAATGAQASNMNANLLLFNDAFYQLTILTNAICSACGISELKLEADWNGDYSGTVAAIGVTVGTAADPGISKAAMDAALVQWRTNIKSLATKLIAAATAPVAKVVAA